MAAFNLNIVIPNDKVAGMIDALNWQYADEQPKDINGDPIPETAGQLRLRVEAHTIDALKGIYKRHQEYLCEQQAIDDVIAITNA